MTRMEFLHFMTEECCSSAADAEKFWARRPANFHQMELPLLRLLLLTVDAPENEFNPVTGAKIHITSRTALPLLSRKLGGTFDIET